MIFKIYREIKMAFRFLLRLDLLTLVLLFAGGDSMTLAASDVVGTTKSGQGERKEGGLMIYSSVSSKDTGELSKKFQEKYPFIKTEYLRLSSERLLTRILQEARAGKYLADIFQTGVVEVYMFKQKGLVARYPSPQRAAYENYFKDPEGYYTSFFHTTKVIAYNTGLVSTDRAPRSYEDLLHPQWRGKLALPTGGNGVRWFISMMKAMGEKEGEDFMRRLAAQKPALGQDITAVTSLLAAGEFEVAVFTNAHLVEQLKRQGAPVEWVPTRPVLTTQTVVALSSHAPSPKNGKLYIDFTLSREGQELVRSFNRLPARSDVQPDPPRLTKGITLFPYKGEWGEEYEGYAERFRKIFD